MPAISRRLFLEHAASLPALLALGLERSAFFERNREDSPQSSLGAALEAGHPLPTGIPGAPIPSGAIPTLAERFPDLARHFAFEYYPWYARAPWRHWNEGARKPPENLATEYYPLLGAYDSREGAVVEQHARWIAESGVGSISLSWWGQGTFEDRTVHLVMDVMKDHGIAVTFGLESYADDRGIRFADDVLYLLTEYGEGRGWDAFLVLKNADGTESPVIKSFRCILPATIVDCHGVTREIADYTPDDVWRRQIDTVRRQLRWDFDHILLLADSLDFGRTPASGFDGIGIYDNFIGPELYHPLARGASERELLFSFNVNSGYDEILQQNVAPDSCYVPRSFVPPTDPLDFEIVSDRERAAQLSAGRIRESLAATIEAQSDPMLSNFRRGFFLVYINSFNEWHEGHGFEPMKDDLDLTEEQRLYGYHNPRFGDYRLATLAESLRPFLSVR